MYLEFPEQTIQGMYIKMDFEKPKWQFLATEKILMPMSFYFFLVLLFLFGLSSTLFKNEKT